MSKLNILVIDDSEEFTTGLERLLNSMGHTASVCSLPEQAKSLLRQQDFDFILIDCFMPIQDGFSLSGELHETIKQVNGSTQIILMSGILIDDDSKKEADSYSHVKDFLIKPLSKDGLNKAFLNLTNPDSVDSVLSEFLHENLTENEIEKILTSTKTLHGFELCYILPFLSIRELSYKINLFEPSTNSEFNLSIESGLVTGISSSEYSNSLGELLVGLGYLTREDLSSYINSDAFKTNKIPIGTALVKLNLLSPHAVPVALKQQNINRLQDVFNREDFQCSFKSNLNEAKYESLYLNQYDIQQESHHWINLNASEFFKKTISSLLIDFIFKKSASLLESDNDYLAINRVLSKDIDDYSTEDFTLIFSSLVQDKIKTSGETETSNSIGKKALFEKVESLKFKLKQNNPFTLFGFTAEEATDHSISKVYQSIAKDLHPDKLGSILNKEELQEVEAIFSEVTKAFNLIKTSDNRKTYESFTKNKRTQIKLHCNNTLEAAKSLLNKGEHSKAYELLNTSEMHETYPHEFGLYFLWAHLKSNSTSALPAPIAVFLEKERQNLTDTSLFAYIQGLIALKNKSLLEFQRFMHESLKLNPQCLPARRELQIVKSSFAVKKKKASKSWFSFKKSS